MLDIRWKQRFENFERAYNLLKSALDIGVENLSDLEKEGTIQRFEYTLELSWKTLKDYLEFNQVKLDQPTPRNVIKEAFAANIIKDGEIWINMLEQKNLLSHTYNQEIFNKAIIDIVKTYAKTVNELYVFLKEKSLA